MSYDIFLKDPETGEYCKLKELSLLKGGTYPLGGTHLAKFNITYNYSKIFHTLFGENGIATIYGLSGSESILLLTEAILKLENNDGETDYWLATNGNAKIALEGLLYLAGQCPTGIWCGD
jgi:hypothetical protein